MIPNCKKLWVPQVLAFSWPSQAPLMTYSAATTGHKGSLPHALVLLGSCSLSYMPLMTCPHTQPPLNSNRWHTFHDGPSAPTSEQPAFLDLPQQPHPSFIDISFCASSMHLPFQPVEWHAVPDHPPGLPASKLPLCLGSCLLLWQECLPKIQPTDYPPTP